MRSRLIRDVVSVTIGLVAAILTARAIAFAGLFAIAHGLQITPTVTVARAANLLFVPLAAGLVVGAFKPRRPVVLAVLLVVVSLAGTYLALGPDGLPHGEKILAYLAQTGIVAIAAVWMSHRHSSPGGRWGSPREAVGLTIAEADERSDEAHFARYDPTRLQMSPGVR
jgi:hypothetical protein